MICRKTASLCLLFEPSAAGHETDPVEGICRPLLLINLAGKIIFRRTFQVGTISARVMKPGTGSGMVTDSGNGPHIVHRPHHFFPGSDDLPYLAGRQHRLVDPMQVNDIGLRELG
jgi:hypothetical protein